MAPLLILSTLLSMTGMICDGAKPSCALKLSSGVSTAVFSSGALDYNTSKEILKLIETVNHKYGNTIVMVTHNDAIKDMADRVVKLRDGMIRRNYQNENKIPAAELEW